MHPLHPQICNFATICVCSSECVCLCVCLCVPVCVSVYVSLSVYMSLCVGLNMGVVGVCVPTITISKTEWLKERKRVRGDEQRKKYVSNANWTTCFTSGGVLGPVTPQTYAQHFSALWPLPPVKIRSLSDIICRIGKFLQFSIHKIV